MRTSPIANSLLARAPSLGGEKSGCAVSSRSTSTWEGPGPLLLVPVGSRCPKGSAGGMPSSRNPLSSGEAFLRNSRKQRHRDAD